MEIDVRAIGTRKTGVCGFVQLCNTLNRRPETVSQYFELHLNTPVTFCRNGRIEFSRVIPKREVEHVLHRFIQGYVLCPSCRSSDTADIDSMIVCLGGCGKRHRVH